MYDFKMSSEILVNAVQTPFENREDKKRAEISYCMG